jgi:hypothetical protein
MSHEIAQHREVFRERIQGQKFSVIELRRLARERHQQLLDPAYSPDRLSLIAEIEELDTMILDQIPAPPEPSELAETNPTLAYTIKGNELKQQVADAAQFVEDHPNSPDAPKRLEAAEKALAEHTNTLPPFAQNMIAAKEFRALAEKTLLSASDASATPEESQQRRDQAEKLFAKARSLDLGTVSTGRDDPLTDEEVVRRAEQAVDAAMAGAGE